MGKKSQTDFEEAAEGFLRGDHMGYIQMRQTGEGEKIQINDQKGLLEYLKGLNTVEKQAGRKRKLSTKFMHGMAQSEYARKHLPKTFGSYGTIGLVFGQESQRPPEALEREKVIVAKNQAEGRQTYRYPGGLAVRARIKARGATPEEPKYRYGFRDATTGRMISKKDISEYTD